MKANLEHRLISLGQRERVRDVVIPTEQVVETWTGRRSRPSRRLPGYVLVNMDMTPDTLWLVKNTPGVTGFVGAAAVRTSPCPCPSRRSTGCSTSRASSAPKVRADFTEGESVKVIAALVDFTGEIAEINAEQGRLKVLVSIFGRETPAELSFDQVKKAHVGRRGRGPAHPDGPAGPLKKDVVAKKVLQVIKLQIPAGQASPRTPVGPALGGASINIMDVLQGPSTQTQSGNGTITPVEVTVFEDRSFTFMLKTPPAAVLIRQALGIEKGSPEPHKEKVAEPRRAAAADRRDEDARPQRQQRRVGRDDDRGDGA